MITLQIDGAEYQNFTKASVELRLDALANSFSFSATAPVGGTLPFSVGSACKVIVEGFLVLTGYVEVISGGYDSESHTTMIRGRGKTGDVVDSSLFGGSSIKPPISLKEIIEKALSSIGSSVVVDDQVRPPLFETAEDLASPETGKGVFEFIEAFARKRQVMLTSNENGDIVILKTPGPTINSLILQNVIGSNNNNIKSASYSTDQTGRFNIYRMASGLNPITVNITANSSTAEMVNQYGEAMDSGIRTGRQMAVTPEAANSSIQNIQRAEWERRIRQARGIAYRATLEGHLALDTKSLWKLNSVINVFDEMAGITQELLISAITYNVDVTSGTTASLSLVDKNSYNLLGGNIA